MIYKFNFVVETTRIKERLIWRVGDVRDIEIWSKPWVEDERGRFIESERVEGLNVVNDLISEETKEWKIDWIEKNFCERDKKCIILSIALNSREVKDDLNSAFSKDSLYLMKTTYMIGKGDNLDDLYRAWVVLWGLEVSPKSYIFFGILY